MNDQKDHLTTWPAARRLSAMLSAAVLLSACATGTPPRAAAVSLPQAYAAQSLPAPAANIDQWWLLYEDAELTALTERAMAQGFSVRVALARLAESRALRSASLARFDPQGNLQGNVEHRDTRDLGGSHAAVVTGVSKTSGISLPVSWEMDLFDRRGATRAVVEADIEIAQFDVEGARVALAAEVAKTLFQVRGLKAQTDEALETVRIQQELLAAVTERTQRGLAPASELDRVAADLAQAQAQAEDLAATLRTARRALTIVLGSGTVALSDDEQILALGQVPEVPGAMPADLLARRPDVRIAASRIQKSAGSVRLAELDFFPRLTLNPGLGVSAAISPIESNTSFWSLAAGITVPVLDRPRLQAQLSAEGARAEQAVLAYERVVQTAFSEVDQALTRLQADRRRVGILSTGETRARASYEAARQRYELGFANLQELLDAERAWRATRSALSTAKVDALQRSVQVFQALGGGWSATAAPTTNTKG